MLKTSPGGQSVLADFEKRLTGRVPDDSDVPGPVRKAVRFMLAGGAVTALIGVILTITLVINKNALVNSNGQKVSNSQFTSGVVSAVVFYAILVGLWVLMARLNRAGHSWARIAASGLCAVSTYKTYTMVNSLTGGETITVLELISMVLTLIFWILGVIAIAMLWRSESSAYFRARSAAR